MIGTGSEILGVLTVSDDDGDAFGAVAPANAWHNTVEEVEP